VFVEDAARSAIQKLGSAVGRQVVAAAAAAAAAILASESTKSETNWNKEQSTWRAVP